jgi:uncharacterized membrane protein YoaK (UPF0700 family)
VTIATHEGPLPPLLLGLTVITGLVDAFSFLTLGHVFVANMTGNVVFFGFALAGVGDVSTITSLIAVVAFVVGAALGGRLAVRHPPHRGHLLAAACLVEAVLVVTAAAVVTLAGTGHLSTRLVLASLLAVALGGQNAIVQRLGVPDLTTTVLTRTITALVAEPSPVRVRARRGAAVISMFAGALVGGMLLRFTVTAAPLWVAAAGLGVCAAGAYVGVRSPWSEAWR